MASTLFNGSHFPEYVFNKEELTYVFVEFSTVFQDEFLVKLQSFLEKHDIPLIAIENVEPKGYAFYEEVNVKQFPASFKQAVSAESIKTYLKATISFQMLTEQGLIYAPENDRLFCIVLERDYWTAIIGLSQPDDLHFFTEFAIENMIDFLSTSFSNDRLSEDFKGELHRNWR